MDNFMSKLSQKINGQDAIKANLMAETAEKEQMKKQLDEYAILLQDMRTLCEKQGKTIEGLKEAISRSDEFTHRECVKVYRNVGALLEKQDKQVEEHLAELQKGLQTKEEQGAIDELCYMQSETERHTSTTKILVVITLFLALLNTSYLVATVLSNFFHFKLF